MALLDACSRSVGLPLHQLLGGAVHDQVDYFYYLGRQHESQLRQECRAGLSGGFRTFYVKVGIDEAEDLRLANAAVEELGTNARLRVDANAAWTPPVARRLMTRLEAIGVELCEQPVSESPPELMRDLRAHTSMWLSANEGLWSEADAYARILARQADVYCFSPYWVGSFRAFQALARVAEWEGSLVCKHTHGETAVAAAAMQQLMLTVPNLIPGNQQTSHLLAFDLASETLPIVAGPTWPRDDRPGIGIEVDEDSVGRANDLYRSEGQYLPYGDVATAREGRSQHG
jgi:L-alanine-DL-glutamate epimerase-like enolase superfamily enzyme